MIKLDLGCGLLKLPDYVGVDVSRNGGLVDVVADIQFLPFKTESVNYIRSSRVIQHVQDDHKAMREIFRVLKKNGFAQLTFASWLNAVAYKLKNFNKKTNYNIFHYYTEHNLSTLWKQAGFSFCFMDKLQNKKLKVFWDYHLLCSKKGKKITIIR